MTSALTLDICCSKNRLHQAPLLKDNSGGGLEQPFLKRYERIWISKGKCDSLLTHGTQERSRITVLMQISCLNTYKKLNFHQWFE